MDDAEVFMYGGKVIGEVSGNRYRKTIVPSKHRCRKYEGYGIQIEAFEELVDMGVTKVMLRFKNTNEYLVSDVSQWVEDGITDCLHRSFGTQVFLAEDLMEKKVIE